MSDKNLTIFIGGRLAIPVRALPYITKRNLHPERIVEIMARESDLCPCLSTISCYSLASGVPVKRTPKEWWEIGIHIQALDSRLNEKYADDSNQVQGNDRWLRESVMELPIGIFVWHDEFEARYHRDFYQFSEDDSLTYTPMIDDELRKKVFAGFEELAHLESQRIESAVRSNIQAPQAAPASEAGTPTAEPAVKGVTTAEIVEAFGDLVTIKLGKAMTDKALWTEDARITSGTKGGRYKSLWNPVVMATALHERNKIPMSKLNQAFNTRKFLADWREEWNRFSAM